MNTLFRHAILNEEQTIIPLLVESQIVLTIFIDRFAGHDNNVQIIRTKRQCGPVATCYEHSLISTAHRPVTNMMKQQVTSSSLSSFELTTVFCSKDRP